MNVPDRDALTAAIERFRRLVGEINAAMPDLAALIQRLVDGRGGPAYTVETPVVFNTALDAITGGEDIKLILAADNPGRREQAAENRRYLVGPSGKIAGKFFREHPELGVDFYRNVLILNKTPIHTPRTVELKELCILGGKAMKDAVLSSQRVMAELLGEFREALTAPARTKKTAQNIPVWIIGYSEMKKGGIFEEYTRTLASLCAASPGFRENLFFFRHFSMNQFTIDLKQQATPGEDIGDSLRRIGAAYRERVLNRI